MTILWIVIIVVLASVQVAQFIAIGRAAGAINDL